MHKHSSCLSHREVVQIISRACFESLQLKARKTVEDIPVEHLKYLGWYSCMNPLELRSGYAESLVLKYRIIWCCQSKSLHGSCSLHRKQNTQKDCVIFHKFQMKKEVERSGYFFSLEANTNCTAFYPSQCPAVGLSLMILHRGMFSFLLCCNICTDFGKVALNVPQYK